jgi:hypothetical protein
MMCEDKNLDLFSMLAEQIGITLDSRYVEHDAFFLFSTVMATAIQWYEFNDEPRRTLSSKVN